MSLSVQYLVQLQVGDIIVMWLQNYDCFNPIIIDEDFLSFTSNLIYNQSLDPNQTLCVNINIVDDSLLENNDAFAVSVSSADSSVITGPQSSVIIIDNDG